eukprot:366462-Chlamydomonas_euryale.AAC.25
MPSGVACYMRRRRCATGTAGEHRLHPAPRRTKQLAVEQSDRPSVDLLSTAAAARFRLVGRTSAHHGAHHSAPCSDSVPTTLVSSEAAVTTEGPNDNTRCCAIGASLGLDPGTPGGLPLVVVDTFGVLLDDKADGGTPANLCTCGAPGKCRGGARCPAVCRRGRPDAARLGSDTSRHV